MATATHRPAVQPQVLISEVGPRDGLQSINRTLPTAASAPGSAPCTPPACARSRWVRSCRCGCSTAFGCTLQGAVPEAEVLWLAGQRADAGVDEAGLSDTTGMANPAQVRRLFTGLRAAIGPKAGAAHLHNTRGLGLANCLAAWDAGERTFDASQGGLGGCPHAPGASGNVVTEDLVFMFEAMGVPTGIDLQRLSEARDVLAQGLPGEPLVGMLAEAGLPPGFAYADGRRPELRTAQDARPGSNG